MPDIDTIWAQAREKAYVAFGKYAIDQTEEHFECENPYPIGTLDYEEYEAAWEHYIMTGLGY